MLILARAGAPGQISLTASANGPSTVITLVDLEQSIDRSDVLFCSVVTRSHLSHAWVLRQAMRRHHPEEPFCILVVDAVAEDTLPEKSHFDVPLIRLDDLMTPNIADMTIYYSAYELCGNIKPYFLLYLFSKTRARKIIYLDSDLFVTSPLWTASAILDTHDVTAAPHSLSPIPDDGREPSDLTIAANGAYNTGFLGFRRTAKGLDLLGWMAERVHRRGFNAFSQGMFCEQRFFNLGVTFLKERFQPVTLESYNVGYWNLHERVITRRPGGYFANEQRVVFFHMSGFRLDNPDLLSIYDERHNLTTYPQAAVLRHLTSEYRALFADVPFPAHSGYRFDTHKGQQLTPEMRRHYHQHGILPGVVSMEDALKAARQHENAGQLDKAAQIYAAILQKAPRTSAALLGYAGAVAQLGRRTQARQILHQLLALTPDHREAKRRLALLEQHDE